MFSRKFLFIRAYPLRMDINDNNKFIEIKYITTYITFPRTRK